MASVFKTGNPSQLEHPRSATAAFRTRSVNALQVTRGRFRGHLPEKPWLPWPLSSLWRVRTLSFDLMIPDSDGQLSRCFTYFYTSGGAWKRN